MGTAKKKPQTPNSCPPINSETITNSVGMRSALLSRRGEMTLNRITWKIASRPISHQI